jgi:hypothetical protein
MFFTGVDWEKMNKKLVKPPFKPKLEGPFDSKYFEDKEINIAYDETLTSGLDSSSYMYQDFTYNHDEKDY